MPEYDIDSEMEEYAKEMANIEQAKKAPLDPTTKMKKRQLILDYLEVINIERKFYIAQHSSPSGVNYFISIPSLNTLTRLSDTVIESILDELGSYQQLKKLDENLVSDSHNKVILTINGLVTKLSAGKKSRRKKQKRRTKKLKRNT